MLIYRNLFQETNFREPLNKFSYETLKELNLRYYTPGIHRAAFALPLVIAEVSDSEAVLLNSELYLEYVFISVVIIETRQLLLT